MGNCLQCGFPKDLDGRWDEYKNNGDIFYEINFYNHHCASCTIFGKYHLEGCYLSLIEIGKTPSNEKIVVMKTECIPIWYFTETTKYIKTEQYQNLDELEKNKRELRKREKLSKIEQFNNIQVIKG